MGGDSRGDFDLIRAARAGDEGAWAAFVRRWADLLYGCCRKVFDETECAAEFPALIRRLGADRLALHITTLLAADTRRGWTAREGCPSPSSPLTARDVP